MLGTQGNRGERDPFDTPFFRQADARHAAIIADCKKDRIIQANPFDDAVDHCFKEAFFKVGGLVIIFFVWLFAFALSEGVKEIKSEVRAQREESSAARQKRARGTIPGN